MPSYHYDSHHHHHKRGYELAQHLGRDLQHSNRPTRYIVNDGKLILDDRSFDNYYGSGSTSKSNTVIYNAPGSTLWIEHAKPKTTLVECRGCFRRRERCYDGYCSECISVSIDRGKRHEIIAVDERRYVEYPERRAIKWR
jgi:hypothetical protein